MGEFLLLEVSGIVLLEGKPVALDLEELGVEVGTADARDVGAKFTEAIPIGFGIIGGKGASGSGVLKAGPAREFFAEVFGKRLRGGLRIFEVVGEFKSLLANKPTAEAALFPFGEVLFVDGSGVEFGCEQGFDFEKIVKPRENGVGLLAVSEATVELITNGVWETGNFSVGRTDV